jgi:hypothetical protein
MNRFVTKHKLATKVRFLKGFISKDTSMLQILILSLRSNVISAIGLGDQSLIGVLHRYGSQNRGFLGAANIATTAE